MEVFLVCDWEVKVYLKPADFIPVASWKIRGTTEADALKQAEADVNLNYPDLDWTMTPA